MSLLNPGEPTITLPPPILTKGLLSINVIATYAGMVAIQNIQVIVVGNLGPPVFKHPLINQEVSLNKYHEYTLPIFYDLDGDSVRLNIQMNTANMFT